MKISRSTLERSILRDSFYEFVKRFWSVVVAEKPVWNWHIRIVCRELQKMAKRVAKGKDKLYDLIANIPPGTTKTLIVSVMFPAWVWTFFPSARFICVSYAENLALDSSRRCRDIVESDKWRELFGDVQIRDDQNTKSNFENKHKGYRHCAGIDGTLTGKHAHFLIIDDPINPKGAASKAELENVNAIITETLPERVVSRTVAPTIMIMQRLHKSDPTAHMLSCASKDNPIRHIILPAEVTGNGYNEVKPRKYAKYYKKDPHERGKRLLDVRRLTRKALKLSRAKLREYGYAGQMLQRPAPASGGMFKIDRIRTEPVVNRERFTRLIRFWDKAGTLDGGAYTVGLLLGIDRRGSYWVLDVIRRQLDSAQREELIEDTAKEDGKGVEVGVEQEPGSGGKESAQGTAKRLKGYIVHIVRPSGSKEMRAEPVSSQVNAENFYMAIAGWNKDFKEELQYFPKSEYMDQVDALSGAFTIMCEQQTEMGVL